MIAGKQQEVFTGRVIVTMDFSNGTLCRAAGRVDESDWRYPEKA